MCSIISTVGFLEGGWKLVINRNWVAKQNSLPREKRLCKTLVCWDESFCVVNYVGLATKSVMLHETIY